MLGVMRDPRSHIHTKKKLFDENKNNLIKMKIIWVIKQLINSRLWQNIVVCQCFVDQLFALVYLYLATQTNHVILYVYTLV